MQEVKFDKILKQQQWGPHQPMWQLLPHNQEDIVDTYIVQTGQREIIGKEGKDPIKLCVNELNAASREGGDIYLCNTGGDIGGGRKVISCHHKFHTQKSQLASSNGHPSSPANEPVTEEAQETPETPVVPV